MPKSNNLVHVSPRSKFFAQLAPPPAAIWFTVWINSGKCRAHLAKGLLQEKNLCWGAVNVVPPGLLLSATAFSNQDANV